LKTSKEVRRLSRNLMRASYVNGSLDREKIHSLVRLVVEKKPRNHIQLLENYWRLLRLEFDKRRATIESASPIDPAVSHEIVSGLESKYGAGLTTEVVVNPALLGGVRIRVGSDVWDNSVRNRLGRLQQQF
jgi:F-type H+-transporting ATPase subunit delta